MNRQETDNPGSSRTYAISPGGERVLIAEDLGVQERPDLAEQISKFKGNVKFIETNWEELYRMYPNEMVIIQGEGVVVHGPVTESEALWQQVDKLGLRRGSAHWAVLDTPTTHARDLQGYNFGRPPETN